ncbi:MAG: hypothetical protein ABI867_17100 [Kofleriaceae bacterium]
MRVFVAIVFLIGCADPSSELDDPQDAVDGTGKADDLGCSRTSCGDPDARNILFPGNPACSGHGCERGLVGDDLYIPPTNGKPWGETYLLGTAEPLTLSGYSSGRIALLRRLALIGDGTNVVMLDPSWPDGARDFADRGPERGEDIVRDWLYADPARTFTLVYSTRSVGWSNYVTLRDDADIGSQVTICALTKPHLLIPTEPGLHAALVDPVAWAATAPACD